MVCVQLALCLSITLLNLPFKVLFWIKISWVCDNPCELRMRVALHTFRHFLYLQFAAKIIVSALKRKLWLKITSISLL